MSRKAPEKFNRWAEMPEQRRVKFFKIFNGHSIVDTTGDVIFYRMGFLHEHFPTEKLDNALAWLISNNYVGAKFVDWFMAECKASDLQMHAKLLSIVDNDPTLRLIAGKNFLI